VFGCDEDTDKLYEAQFEVTSSFSPKMFVYQEQISP
jgi:hypothetical protein